MKLLPLTISTDPTAVTRFRREAEVAATLNHPGITTVFDIDEHREGDERWLFLVMELMVGRDLRHLLSASPEGLPIERVRKLTVQVADALAAAHRRGVVHRDIKPANLFLLEEDRVKICDFGISHLADATRITATGSVAGTPLYMAPEQIQGRAVDHRTDLYAFGCVLYELLTGTPWVTTGSNVAAILYQHLNQSPTPPQSARPEIPSQLSVLVLELLAKDPGDRPRDAASVGDRLRDIPDEPRPPAAVTRVSEATIADGTRPLPAPPGPPETLTQPDQPDNSVIPPVPLVSVSMGRRAALLSALAVTGVSTTAWLLLKDQDAGSSTDTRFEGHIDEVNSVAFSPDGKTVATGSADSTVRLWDVETGLTTATLTGHWNDVESVAFSPDGRTLATGGSESTVRLWDVATGRTTATLQGHMEDVLSVAFSPDGGTVATCSSGHTDAVLLWDVASTTISAPVILNGDFDSFSCMAFSPDGGTLVTSGRESAVQLWDVATARVAATLTGHTSSVCSAAFSPDGQTLATGSDDGTVRLWDVETQGVTAVLDVISTGGSVWVAFSPDGRTLASSSADYDPAAKLWNVAEQRLTAEFHGHESSITALAFSPDGSLLATGSRDYTARLWEIPA